MRAKDPKKTVDRQIAGVNASMTKIRDGLNAVSKSPGVAAAEQIDVMVQNFLAAVNDGSLEAALRGVDLEDWRAAALAGVSEIGPGMEKKRSVIEEFHRQLQDYQLRYTQDIDAMEKGTKAASRARMNANFDAMSEFSFKK